MQKKWLIALPILLIILVLCVAIAGIMFFSVKNFNIPGINWFSNRIRAEETIHQEFSVHSPAALNITNPYGEIIITGGEVDEIHIEARKIAYGFSQADAQNELASIQVDMTRDGDRVVVNVPHDEVIGNINDLKHKSVEFTITVPVKTVVEADSDFGDISISGTEGKTNLESSFGSVTVRDLNGELVIRNQNGSIAVENIQAGQEKVQINASFGSIEATKVTAGSIYMDSENGGISLKDGNASGMVTLKSSFGEVDFIGGSADLVDINSSNGGILLQNVQASSGVTATSSFGDVDIVDVTAKHYTLESSNGRVKLDGVAGVVKAKSGFGDIEVFRAEDMTIDLQSDNGSIEFVGSLADGPHVVKTNFGSITLKLPEDSNLNLDLSTDFGSIDVDFDLLVSGKQSDKLVHGKIGGGGDLLQAESNNGSIKIEILK